MAKEENEIDFQEETISLEDPFKMDYDPFELEDISLDKEKEEEGEQEEEEEQKVVPPVKKTKETSEESFEQEEEEQEEEEEKEEEEEEESSMPLQAGIEIAKFIARKKKVFEHINFEAIETTEDLEEILESFDALDSVVAKEELKRKDATIAKIVDYIDKGGKPDEVINILTQSKEIAEIDVETETGCKKLLRDYYKNVVGFDDSKIDSRIKKFEESDMLMEEAKDVLPLYQEKLDKEMAAKTAKLEQDNITKDTLLKQTQADFVRQLQANKYSREIASRFYQTAFSEVVIEGKKMSVLDAKINDLRKTPEGLLKLSSFITDSEFYDKQVIANKGSKIIADKTANRLNFNNNNKQKGSAPSKKTQEDTGLKFKFK